MVLRPVMISAVATYRNDRIGLSVADQFGLIRLHLYQVKGLALVLVDDAVGGNVRHLAFQATEDREV